jgi:hypothetical protein
VPQFRGILLELFSLFGLAPNEWILPSLLARIVSQTTEAAPFHLSRGYLRSACNRFPSSMSSEQPAAQRSTLAESQHKSTHKQAVKSGRGYILAISILQLVAGLAFLAIYLAGQTAKTRPMLAIAVTMILLGLVYMGLWIWAKTAPFAAALVALVIYLAFLALDAVFAPQQIAQGIIVKILIIAGLSQAVKSGYALKKAAESQA